MLPAAGGAPSPLPPLGASWGLCPPSAAGGGSGKQPRLRKAGAAAALPPHPRSRVTHCAQLTAGVGSHGQEGPRGCHLPPATCRARCGRGRDADGRVRPAWGWEGAFVATGGWQEEGGGSV